MNNEFDFKLLNSGSHIKIGKLKNPKILIISGIIVIIIGILCMINLKTSIAGAFILVIFLLIFTLIFLNAYSNYSYRVAMNTPTITSMKFLVNPTNFISEISYYIALDRKGPRTSTTIFNYKDIQEIRYNTTTKILTLVGHYKNVVSFDNPNQPDVNNDFSMNTNVRTLEYKIDLENDFTMLNLIKTNSGLNISITQ